MMETGPWNARRAMALMATGILLTSLLLLILERMSVLTLINEKSLSFLHWNHALPWFVRTASPLKTPLPTTITPNSLGHHHPLHFCHSWPLQLVLVHQGSPISLLVLEAASSPGPAEAQLEILVAAVTHDNGTAASTTGLGATLERLAPAFKCDFRRGSMAHNAQEWPIQRSGVTVTLLAENNNKSAVSVKLTCDLPRTGIKELTYKDVPEEERLHWQLFLDPSVVQQQEKDNTTNTWLSSDSRPLCTGGAPAEDVIQPEEKKQGPHNTLRKRSQKSSASSSQTEVLPRVGLCVAPSIATSLEVQSIWKTNTLAWQDWIDFQNTTMGVSSAFYLDPLGDNMKLALEQSNMSQPQDFWYHVPHTALHRQLSNIMKDFQGSVAQSLIRQRCVMLARLHNLDQVLQVEDPRELIVVPSTLKPQESQDQKFLPMAVSQIYQRKDGCPPRVIQVPVVSSVDPSTSSQLEQSSFRSIWRMTEHPRGCGYEYESSMPATTVSARELMVVTPSSQTKESFKCSQQDATRNVTREKSHFLQRPNINRTGASNSTQELIPTSAESATVHMCPNKNGPLYGEASVSVPQCQPCQDGTKAHHDSNEELRLTFYNAEIQNSSLTLSVYADDKDSRNASFYHPEYGTKIYQSPNVFHLLPEVNCVFSSTDEHHVPVQTPGQWRRFGDLPFLLWLDCGLPRTSFLLSSVVPTSSIADGGKGVYNTVTIEASSSPRTSFQVHMIRAITLCGIESVSNTDFPAKNEDMTNRGQKVRKNCNNCKKQSRLSPKLAEEANAKESFRHLQDMRNLPTQEAPAALGNASSLPQIRNSNRTNVANARQALLSTGIQSYVRMCNKYGPLYGEASVFVPQRQPCQDGTMAHHDSNEELRLTFYNAEIQNSSLTLSVYADDKDSQNRSFHHPGHHRKICQSPNVFHLLPEMNCVFSSPNGHHPPVRTRGQWRRFGDLEVLLWLDCPLPGKSLASPIEGEEIHSTITIEAASSSTVGPQVHMLSAITLCSNEPPYAVSAKKKDTTNQYHTEKVREQSQHPQKLEQESSSNGSAKFPGKDQALSICLRPFFLETECRICDGIEPISAVRLIEWVEYHLLIGFDVIYIMDRHGYTLLPFLQGYVEAGQVVHVPFSRLSDTVLSPEARSPSTKINPAGHDQIMAYDHCVSLGRLNNDAFMALIDVDEFVKYPESQPGQLRSVVKNLLGSHWNSSGLPDSIYLDRYDVAVEEQGLALSYNRRTQDKRVYTPGEASQRYGKIMVRPQAVIKGFVRVHSAWNATGERISFRKKFPHGSNNLIPPNNELTIFHYRKEDKREWISPSSRTTYADRKKLVQDVSLEWAYHSISSKILSTSGFVAFQNLSDQGLVRTEIIEAHSPISTDAVVFERRRPLLWSEIEELDEMSSQHWIAWPFLFNGLMAVICLRYVYKHSKLLVS